MEVQQHTVAAGRHRRANPIGHIFVGIVIDSPTGRRIGSHWQRHLGAGAGGQFAIGTKSRARVRVGRLGRFALQGDRRFGTAREPGERCRHRRKGVGFMLHHGDDETHGRSPGNIDG